MVSAQQIKKKSITFTIGVKVGVYHRGKSDLEGGCKQRAKQKFFFGQLIVGDFRFWTYYQCWEKTHVAFSLAQY